MGLAIFKSTLCKFVHVGWHNISNSLLMEADRLYLNLVEL